MNPDIYLYNPTCELAVANGSENFMANRLLRKMEYDLDLLPAFFAGSRDITLVQKDPGKKFLDSLEEAGFNSFGLRLAAECFKDPTFISQPKGFLCPWGWSPAAHKLLSPLKPSCSEGFLNSPVASWKQSHKELYSRKEGRGLLAKILESDLDWMTPPEELPLICTTHEEIFKLQKRWESIIVKSPWSSSGRGLQVLRPGEYNRSNYQVIDGFFHHQGYVLAERKYNKLLDLSFQFYSRGNGKIDFMGICTFKTDRSGRYLGSYLEPIPIDLEPSIFIFLQEHLDQTKNLILFHLNNSDWSLKYQGWLGVDSIVYRTETDQLKIQPCIEVNCRFTMGTIILALRRNIAEGSSGIFKIDYFREGQLNEYYKQMGSRMPWVIQSNQIVKGFLPLTFASDDTKFGASLSIY